MIYIYIHYNLFDIMYNEPNYRNNCRSLPCSIWWPAFKNRNNVKSKELDLQTCRTVLIDYSIMYGGIEKLRFVGHCGTGATACWSFHNCHPTSVILATLVLVVDKDWSWAARMPTNEKVIQTYNSKEMTRTKIELIE